MLPTLPASRAATPTLERRAEAGLPRPPADATGSEPVQATPREPVPGALQHLPATRLQDMPAELHAELFRYLEPESVVGYADALGSQLPTLPEVDAAAMKLKIREAPALEDLRDCLPAIAALDPACRDQALHDVLAALKSAIAPLAHDRDARLLLAAYGPALVELADGCDRAADGLVPWKAASVRQECHQVRLAVAIPTVADTRQLQDLLPQLGQLRRARIPAHAIAAIQEVVRMAGGSQPSSAAQPDYDRLVLACLQAADCAPPAARSRVLWSGYEACLRQARFGGPPWPETEKHLQDAVERLPPALLYTTIPTIDNRFADAVGLMLSRMPAAERTAHFDAVFDSLPAGDHSEWPSFSALGDMTALLRRLEPEHVFSRFSQIVGRASDLGSMMLNRLDVFRALADDATFARLPAQQVAPAIERMMDAVGRAPLHVSGANSILASLIDRVARAPAGQRQALLLRLLQAQHEQAARRSTQRV